MHALVNKHPFRVGVTSSLAIHIVAGLIAAYVLVYEPPPLDMSQVRPMTAIPILLDKPRSPEPKSKPRPQEKPSLKKAEDPPPPPEELPSPPELEVSPTPGYLSLVRGILEANKRYPRRALERGEQGVVVLWFVINRYGQVINYRIEQSSGSTILDGEVVRLIKKVQKFPFPMPDETMKDSQEITMPIRFVLVDDPEKAGK